MCLCVLLLQASMQVSKCPCDTLSKFNTPRHTLTTMHTFNTWTECAKCSGSVGLFWGQAPPHANIHTHWRTHERLCGLAFGLSTFRFLLGPHPWRLISINWHTQSLHACSFFFWGGGINIYPCHSYWLIICFAECQTPWLHDCSNTQTDTHAHKASHGRSQLDGEDSRTSHNLLS